MNRLETYSESKWKRWRVNRRYCDIKGEGRIDRLGVEYGKLGEPWRFVARLADIIAAGDAAFDTLLGMGLMQIPRRLEYGLRAVIYLSFGPRPGEMLLNNADCQTTKEYRKSFEI